METRKSHNCDARCATSWSPSSCLPDPAQQIGLQSNLHPTVGECRTNGPLLKALAETIRKRRLHVGISQQTLAEVTGLDRSYLISIEHAKRNPSITTLAQIADGLSISTSELLGLAEREMEERG